MRKLLTIIGSCLSLIVLAQNPNQISRINESSNSPFNSKLAPFYHGVASGDPLEDAVIIWTRFTPESDGDYEIKWRVAKDTAFQMIVLSGQKNTNSDIDYTVKVDVTNLEAGQTYYYQFEYNGKKSIIGRTKTAASKLQNINNLKFAVVSCANYEGGYFNAFGALSKRNDIDAVLHLGDYIYEYEPKGYRNFFLKDTTRKTQPFTEIVTLSDYRTRYSLYRLDQNLMFAHQQQPFIPIWDDHESTNDSYFDGAENHDASEGDWFDRKAVSKKVYYEWMPIRDSENLYRNFSYGNLAEIIMLDTRLEARVQPPLHFDSPDTLSKFRRMISDKQFNFLIDNLSKSTAKWKIIGNQVIFSNMNIGFGAPSQAITNIDSIRTVEDSFIDNWESYPIQRNRIIDSIRIKKINNVLFTTGDSHCSWAFDVTTLPNLYPFPQSLYIPQPNPYNPSTQSGYNDSNHKGSWAVEFCTPSISSQNFDELGFSPQTIAQFEFSLRNAIPIPGAGLVNYNPHLEYVNLSKHGYFILDLKSDSAQANYYFVSSIVEKSLSESFGKGISVKVDSNYIGNTSALESSKGKESIPAPFDSQLLVTNVGNNNSENIILSIYPNPASDFLLMNFVSNGISTKSINIYNISGKLEKRVNNSDSNQGNFQLGINVSDLKNGSYFIAIESENNRTIRKFIKN